MSRKKTRATELLRSAFCLLTLLCLFCPLPTAHCSLPTAQAVRGHVRRASRCGVSVAAQGRTHQSGCGSIPRPVGAGWQGQPDDIRCRYQRTAVGLDTTFAILSGAFNELETQFKNACAMKVEPPYTQAMQTLEVKYLASLQRGLETARRSGDNASVAAMQEEIRRATDKTSVPGADAPGTPATLITLRTAYRNFASTTAATRASQLKPLYDSYDAALASLAKALAGKPAEAAAVNAVRSKLAIKREASKTSKPVAK